MVTFDEFLANYAENINEIYESVDMSKNAKIAVVSTMRRYLGNKRFDPISLLNLFESVCYASMNKGSVDRANIRSRVTSEGPSYLSGEEDFYTPDTDFVEIEERARGR